jgi:hypothetical protein
MPSKNMLKLVGKEKQEKSQKGSKTCTYEA